MNIASVFGITVVVILMALYEWPKMEKNKKREKRTFIALTMAGWLLAVLLVYFPDMPGPNQFIDKIFRPLGMLLQ